MPGLKNRTLSSAIVDRLRDAILAGAHPAGSQLRQDALADIYGVSRIPVREALFQLEAEGFVQIVPHKGAMVTGLSLDEVNDVFDLRLLLEPRLFGEAIPRMDETDFEQLDAMQEAFDQAMEAGDLARWGLLNAAFHRALYARAILPRTFSVVAGLLQTSDRYTRLQLSRTAALERASAEHRQLVALARSRAVEAANALLAEHIEGVRLDLVAVLTVNPSSPSP